MSDLALPEAERKRLLGLIHIAKKQLGLDEHNYRALLFAEGGVESAKDLDLSGFKAVLDRMKELGFKVTEKKGKTKLSPTSRQKPENQKTQADKLRALWITGAQEGWVADRSETALNKFCKRFSQRDRLEWATSAQLYKAIEALKAMQERHNGKPSANE